MNTDVLKQLLPCQASILDAKVKQLAKGLLCSLVLLGGFLTTSRAVASEYPLSEGWIKKSSATVGNAFTSEQMNTWIKNGCVVGRQVNPLCRNADGSLVFGGNDLLDTIRQANVAGLTTNYTYVVPNATYTVGTTLYLSGFSDVQIDFQGSLLIPSKSGVKPFDVGGIGIHNVTLTNFKLGSSSKSGFVSALNLLGYSYSPIDGLSFTKCEIAYTSEAGIKLINVSGGSSTSSNSIQNVKVDQCYIHDTGGEGIKVSGAKGVYLSHNVIANPSLVGPLDPGTQDGTVEPVNISVSADTGEITDNDLSGTPVWNRTPFGSSTPASAIYLGGQDFLVARNHIHDSGCTYSLCVGQGGSAPSITVLRPNGGTAANYVSLGDGVHLDLTQRVQVIDNDISGFSNGVVVEISRNVEVRRNHVEKFFSVGLWDNSRIYPGQVNPLSSIEHLIAGPHVQLGTTSATVGCEGGCVTVSIPAHATGNLVCQSASEAFSTSTVIPSLQTLFSTISRDAGTLSLVLYTTANCATDPKSVSLPFPALESNRAIYNYRFPVKSMQDIVFLTTTVSGEVQAGFGSWGIVASGQAPGANTLTIGSFGFELYSESNEFSRNTISEGGVGLAIQGCGAGPKVAANSFFDTGSYTYGQDSYYGYFSNITVFSGTSHTCQRVAPIITKNQITMDRALSSAGNTYYAPIALDSAVSGGSAQIVNPTITDNIFVGPQGTYLTTSHSSVSTAASGSLISGNVGVLP